MFPPATKPLAVVDVVFVSLDSEETVVVVLVELLVFLSPTASKSSVVFFSSLEAIFVFPTISGVFSELLLFFQHEHTPDMIVSESAAARTFLYFIILLSFS